MTQGDSTVSFLSGCEAGLLQRLRLEAFLYMEADLLDEGRLNEWLALFTEDAVYWIPASRYATDPDSEVSILYDERARLEMRIARLLSGNVHSQTPPSRTRRLVTNVRLLEDGAHATRVASNFALTEIRRGKKTIYTGRAEYDLVCAERGWKIRRKKVDLVENNEAIGSLTFLL